MATALLQVTIRVQVDDELVEAVENRDLDTLAEIIEDSLNHAKKGDVQVAILSTEWHDTQQNVLYCSR